MTLISAICLAPRKWEDPGYPARSEAVDKTLQKENRFTEEAVAFAVNQQMSLLTEEALSEWAKELKTSNPTTVGVINPGNIAMVELQDFLAVVLSGHRYLGSLSSKSPYLFSAFLSEIRSCGGEPQATLVKQQDIFGRCQKLIASGTESTIQEIARRAEEGGIRPENCLFRSHRYSVSVLNGFEEEDVLVMLAEDALMHEGLGCRSTAVVFAPSHMPIDPVLEAFAAHRGMFPAHPLTTKSLKMQQAYAEAIGLPNAYSEDFQFLISKGEAAEQGPSHVRWVTYEKLDEVLEWLRANEDVLQCIYADERLHLVHPDWEPIGTAQRPSLTWKPDGKEHSAFLTI